MTVKLVEHTYGMHIYMCFRLDNGRIEGIDIYITEKPIEPPQTTSLKHEHKSSAHFTNFIKRSSRRNAFMEIIFKNPKQKL